MYYFVKREVGLKLPVGRVPNHSPIHRPLEIVLPNKIHALEATNVASFREHKKE